MYKTFNILLIFVCSFGDFHTEAKIGLNSSTPQNLTDLSAIQSKLQKILPIAKKSLVAIEANDGAGSGVIISEDGLVLTAAHVIGKTGKKMNVRLPNGRKFPAISLGGSEISDGGMLRITKKKKWIHASIANKNKTEIGDWCFAIGHPGGFDKERGIVVRLGRVIGISEETMQTDCRLLGGDSGGPLFNFDGEVIAIHSRISQEPDQNFHVPIECYLNNWEFYKNQKILTLEGLAGQGFLGVGCETTTNGLRINSIVENSSAEKAGLRKGDLLINLNGQKLDSREELTILIASLNPDDSIILEYIRGDQKMSSKIALGSRPKK